MKLFTDIFQLIFSVFKFLIARVFTLYNYTNRIYFIIGSTYGKLRSDNSIALYKYIKSTGSTIFFIENRDSGQPDFLRRGSFKSFLVYFGAKAAFFSHSFSDILPNMHKAGILVNLFQHPQRVFLDHGVIGLKNESYDFSMKKYLSSINNTLDLFIATSEIEKEIIIKLGVPTSKIKVTGLPRYDYLEKGNLKKEILIFLTWNNKSDYIKKFKDILYNKKILELQSKGYSIKIFIHDMVEESIMLPEGVDALKTNLSTCIKDACLLITDNSSVAWDFFYKEAEVVFYQPDKNWLITEQFLLDRVAETQNDLATLLVQFPSKSKEDYGRFFKYSDSDNSKRVFDLVKK